MERYKVVSDTSCLIALSYLNRLDLLRELFKEVYITEGVYEEVVIKGKGKIGAKLVKKAVREGWMKKCNVKNKIAVEALLTNLGMGEAETIILAKERKLDFALIDEIIAREKAISMGINVMGTIGIINISTKKGFITNKKEIIDQLIEHGFRISFSLYKRIIKE